MMYGNKVIDVENGCKDYYANASNDTILDTAIHKLKDLENKRIEVNRDIRLVQDSIFLNSKYVNYLVNIHNNTLYRFCENYPKWKSNKLKSNKSKDFDSDSEISKESMKFEEEYIISAMFHEDRTVNGNKYSVKLYNVQLMGFDGYKYLMYFTIGDKYTMEVDIPDRNKCNSITELEKFDNFQCTVNVSKEKYTTRTTYFKWGHQEVGIYLKELINRCIDWLYED